MSDERTPAWAFHHTVSVDGVPESGRAFEFIADEAERLRIAEWLNIPAVASFAVRGRLTPQAKGAFLVEAAFEAALTQSCVVTLEPVAARVSGAFTRLYGDSALAPQRHVIFDEEEPNPPEPIFGNSIDVGAATAEELSLAMEPYPRKEGVALESAEEGAPARENPFAKLAVLKEAAKPDPKSGS